MKYKDLKIGMTVINLNEYCGRRRGKVVALDTKHGRDKRLKYFSIKWDKEENISGSWSKLDFDRLDFKTGQFEDSFDKIIKD